MSTTSPNATLTGADYPADYVELEFTVDEQSLADAAVANLQLTWTDWEPNDGDIEVVLIETLAPYAVSAAEQASAMPPAAFIALGTKLYGIDYQEGVPAQTTVTLTFVDDAGNYLVPAGSEVDLGGYAFQTVDDVTSAVGETTATGVQLVANDVGADFNDLTSADWASVTLPVWVVNLATEAPTSGGVDPQDDYDYLNMLSRELQLRGRMIVTLPDFEIAAVNTPGVGRAYAVTDSARNVTVTLVDPEGEPVTDDVKDTLAATYAAAMLVNVTVTLQDATYTTVSVSYEVVSLPGFDPTILEETINDALSTTLSPLGWGTAPIAQPGSGTQSWLSDNTVRVTKLISLIGSTAGVAYVVNDSILINGANHDLVMSGTVALPQPGTMTGTIDMPVLA
jgi:hypothetical protein